MYHIFCASNLAGDEDKKKMITCVTAGLIWIIVIIAVCIIASISDKKIDEMAKQDPNNGEAE